MKTWFDGEKGVSVREGGNFGLHWLLLLLDLDPYSRLLPSPLPLSPFYQLCVCCVLISTHKYFKRFKQNGVDAQ